MRSNRAGPEWVGPAPVPHQSSWPYLTPMQDSGCGAVPRHGGSSQAAFWRGAPGCPIGFNNRATTSRGWVSACG
jgi:hypothetical protein